MPRASAGAAPLTTAYVGQHPVRHRVARELRKSRAAAPEAGDSDRVRKSYEEKPFAEVVAEVLTETRPPARPDR